MARVRPLVALQPRQGPGWPFRPDAVDPLAPDPTRTPEVASSSAARLTANGANGRIGARARRVAAAEFKLVPARQRHRRAAADKSVGGRARKRGAATATAAKWTADGVAGPRSAPATFLAVAAPSPGRGRLPWKRNAGDLLAADRPPTPEGATSSAVPSIVSGADGDRTGNAPSVAAGQPRSGREKSPSFKVVAVPFVLGRPPTLGGATSSVAPSIADGVLGEFTPTARRLAAAVTKRDGGKSEQRPRAVVANAWAPGSKPGNATRAAVRWIVFGENGAVTEVVP